ncbi:hypothetical protein RFI_07033 [Reticulomyxa filosa]|uniref:Uncharacterized protein n=1 Tax=Reticulomyxa filosa TaxID=46433 RepID=X6NUV7_RETFI|nr:hypothetical protein RFI_07033 [Reticulomyxa filosa]|eukprot:ETO30090.1 hypothetical protein RFI_07033 [Reticulomyxa filosa]
MQLLNEKYINQDLKNILFLKIPKKWKLHKQVPTNEALTPSNIKKANINLDFHLNLNEKLEELTIENLNLDKIAPKELPDIFKEFFFHSGPLRADPPPFREWPQRVPETEGGAHWNNKCQQKISDFMFLAEACRRASKTLQQANCYFCMGILHDNCKHYKKVQKKSCILELIVIAYRYTNISYHVGQNRLSNVTKKTTQNNDNVIRNNKLSDETDVKNAQNSSNVEALSLQGLGVTAVYNALAVDYQLLGSGYFNHSLYYHLLYRDSVKSDDRFVAHINIGLLLLRCGKVHLSLNQQLHALKYAVSSQSDIAQAIAISNIGLCQVVLSNWDIARACLEK